MAGHSLSGYKCLRSKASHKPRYFYPFFLYVKDQRKRPSPRRSTRDRNFLKVRRTKLSKTQSRG